MKTRGLFILCLLIGCLAGAAESKVISFGHNFSPTSNVFAKGDCSFGYQFAACGLTDSLTFGTSPWLVQDYKLANLFLKWKIKDDPDGKPQQALQLGYLKNYVAEELWVPGRVYQMQAAWLAYVYTTRPLPNVAVHTNISGLYFWDDKYPFSLRRPWADKTPTQIDISTLAEVAIGGGFYLNGEIGVLGVLYRNPELLLATSFEFRSENWLFRFGFSQTGTSYAYGQPSMRYDYQSYLLQSPEGLNQIDSYGAKYDYAIHPEITIQYYF